MSGLAGLNSLSGGIGQMAGVAVSGANSLDGIARSIRGLGSSLAVTNPLMAAGAVVLGMFIEELVKAQREAEKLSFKAQEESAKAYIDTLKKMGEVDWDRHKNALKEIDGYWKGIADSIDAARKSEQEMASAEEAFSKVRQQEQMNQELNAAPFEEHAGIRAKYKNYGAKSIAEFQAAKAQREADAATVAIGLAETAFGQKAAGAQSAFGAIEAAQGVGVAQQRALREQGIISDQQRMLRELEDLRRIRDTLSEQNRSLAFDDPERAKRLAYLEKNEGRLQDQALSGRGVTFSTALEEARTKKDLISVQAIEEAQEKIAAANKVLADAPELIRKIGDELRKAGEAIPHASDAATAAGIRAAAAGKNVQAVAQGQNISAQEAADKEAQRLRVQDAANALSGSEKVLNMHLSEFAKRAGEIGQGNPLLPAAIEALREAERRRKATDDAGPLISLLHEFSQSHNAQIQQMTGILSTEIARTNSLKQQLNALQAQQNH